MDVQQVNPRLNELHIVNVGSRNSQLAMIQTQLVVDKLKKYYNDNPASLKKLLSVHGKQIQFNIISMTTSGDQILDKALPDIGTKSLFTKELEIALLEREVDFVVHSLKDLPTSLPSGCIIGAITERNDPNDAIVIKESLRSLITPLDILFGDRLSINNGKKLKIGTSSQRRIAMLRRCNPELDCINIRGNLNTRLAKLDREDGEYDAIILAKAGLDRMQWSDRASSLLSPEEDGKLSDWCYAVGQGAIAVECRQDDIFILDLLAPIVDIKTSFEAAAERSLMKKLEGGCSVPLGVRSTWKEYLVDLHLKAIVLSLDGSEVVQESDRVFIDHESIEDLNPTCMISTTGIVLPTKHDQLKLLKCERLGVNVANKMITSGCLRLIRNNA